MPTDYYGGIETDNACTLTLVQCMQNYTSIFSFPTIVISNNL